MLLPREKTASDSMQLAVCDIEQFGSSPRIAFANAFKKRGDCQVLQVTHDANIQRRGVAEKQ